MTQTLTPVATVLGPFDNRKKRVAAALNKLEKLVNTVQETVRNADGTIGDRPSRVIYDNNDALLRVIEGYVTDLSHIHLQINGEAHIPDPSVRGGPNDL